MQTRSGFVPRLLKPRRAGSFSIMASEIRHQEVFIAWDSLYSISSSQICAYSAETPGYLAQRPHTSAEEMSATSSFPVARPSARMETLFSSTTERLTLAWHWLRAASAPFLRGWIHTAFQLVRGSANANANSIVAQLATSDPLGTPPVSSLYLDPIPYRGTDFSR